MDGALKEQTASIEKELLSMAGDRHNLAAFGINEEQALGISVPKLRQLAKKYPKNKELMEAVWDLGYHESYLLACFLGKPAFIETKHFDWVKCFNSWDICDTVCSELWRDESKSLPYVFKWADDEHEFVRRAAFSLMAVYAVHGKHLADSFFEPFYPLIRKAAFDERNFVKKAVNWALRQIGKRNSYLLQEVRQLAEELAETESKSARWIAKDALREFAKIKTK